MLVDHPSTSSLKITMYFSSDRCWLTPSRSQMMTAIDSETTETKQEAVEEESGDADTIDKAQSCRSLHW